MQALTGSIAWLERLEFQQAHQHKKANNQNEKGYPLECEVVFARGVFGFHTVPSFYQLGCFENSPTVDGTGVTYLKFA
jgi:hypothetical protein